MRAAGKQHVGNRPFRHWPTHRQGCIGSSPPSFRQPALSATHSGTRSFGFLTDYDSHYETGAVLGEGSFSTVHVAHCKSSLQRFAVKCIKKRYQGALLDPLLVRRVHHEVDILNHLGRSLNVVHIRGAYEDDSYVKIVMELCAGGRLQDFLMGQQSCGEADACLLVRDMLRTVAQCHSRGVVIRDVKPDNFMFVPHPMCSTLATQVPGSLKMIDFGLATYLRPGQVLSDRVGSVHYVAPDVLRQRYGFACDVWSVGVVAYLILTGRLPFVPEDSTDGVGMPAPFDCRAGPPLSHKDVFRAVLYADLDFTHPPWDQLSAESQELVQSLLCRDAAKRPTAVEALQHRWFQAEMTAVSKDRLLLTETLVQRLQRFGTYGRLKQAALKQVAGLLADQLVSGSGLNPALQKDELLAAVAGKAKTTASTGPGGAGSADGCVPLVQLEEVLRSGGYELREEEVEALLEGLEVDAKGMVDPQQWVAALVDWSALQESLGQGWDGWVQEVFERFDMDKSGFLEAKDLSRVLCGEEELCEVQDTVPAAFREVEATSPRAPGATGGIDLDGFSALVTVKRDADNLDMFDSRRRLDSESPLRGTAGGSERGL